MAISKGNNNDEKILLNIDADASQAESELDSLFKKLEQLKGLKINASAEDLIKINQEIAETESLISKANKTAINPVVNTDDIDKLNTKLGDISDVEMTVVATVEDIKLPEGGDINVGVKVDDVSLDSLQNKLKDLEEIKLSADTSVLDVIEFEIEQTKSAIQQLNDSSFQPTFDSSGLSQVIDDVKSVGDAIDGVNGDVISPKTNNSELDNTILSLHELEDMLQHIRNEQSATNDPLKLKQLADEAFNLKIKIDEAENGFKDVNQTIGLLEDKLYSMATAGQQGTEEFGRILAEVSQLKQHVKDVDLAVDSLSADKFGQFISVGEGMVQTFGGVTSALQIMGVEAESSEAMIAKLVQLQGIAQGLQGINNLRKQWIAMVATMKTAKIGSDAINALSTSTKTATVSTQALTVAQKAQTIATNVGTVATKALGMAMKALGIGLIISAVAMLITHFDTIKKTIMNMFPVLETLGNWFGKITTAVTDFVGVTSDATRALDQLKRSNEALFTSLDSQIAVMQAMGGKEKEIYDAKVKRIQTERNEIIQTAKLNKELTDEQKKRMLELNDEQNVLFLENKNRLRDEAKDRADKAKDEADKNAQKIADAKKTYDEQLKLLKSYLTQAEEILFNANHNEREIELKKNQDKYKIQLESFDKIAKLKVQNVKAEGKNVNDVIAENESQRNRIVEASRIEENAINKKYDDQYFDFINKNTEIFLTEFAQQYMNVTKEYNSAMENATEEQKADLEKRLNNNLIYLSKMKQQKEYIDEAQRDLDRAKVANEIDEDVDSFKIQKQKLDAQLQADKEFYEAQLWNATESKRIENEQIERLYIEGQERLKQLMQDPSVNATEISNVQAELDAKLIAIQENNDAIENATSEHLQKLKKAEIDNDKAKKKIDKEAGKSRIDSLNAYGDAIGAVGGILAEHTVAFKAMSVASTLINTYASIAGQLKAFSGVPLPGYAIAQAIATGAVGFAQVAKILSVQVPNDTGSSGRSTASSTPTPTVAPTINTTVLKQAENGNSQVVESVNKNSEAMENGLMKAYVVGEEIETDRQKKQFADNTRKIF